MRQSVTHKKCSKCGEVKAIALFRDKRRCCKSCYSQYTYVYIREYYKKNKEKILTQVRGYQVANKNAIAARQKRFRDENRDRVIESKKQSYQRNKEEIAARKKVRYANNRDEILKKRREEYQNHPEIYLNIEHKRRARKRNATGNYTYTEFKALCERYGNICLCCHQSKKLTADHVVPLVSGGTNGIENIQPLCKSCNSKKATKTIDYRN